MQVFMPWEGVAAQRAGVELNAFKLGDFGIPYCYSPVLAVHPQTLAQSPDLVRSFLAATAKGYEFAAEHPAEAAQLLCAEVAADVAKAGKGLPEPLNPAMVAQSQELISQHYLETVSKKWGR
jgi:ABC-type nitrate/sulfonate/bicarbonate transport system substrate-binding protein